MDLDGLSAVMVDGGQLLLTTMIDIKKIHPNPPLKKEGVPLLNLFQMWSVHLFFKEGLGEILRINPIILLN